jgi:DNA-binding transcriptional regulator YiaG
MPRAASAQKIVLSQVGFARQIGVPVDTVRNREQGKRAAPAPGLTAG